MTAIERLRAHVDEMCVNAGDGVCTEDCDRCDISTLRWLIDQVEAECATKYSVTGRIVSSEYEWDYGPPRPLLKRRFVVELDEEEASW